MEDTITREGVREFFRLAGNYLRCRLAVMDQRNCHLLHVDEKVCMEQCLLGMVDQEMEMEIIVYEKMYGSESSK